MSFLISLFDDKLTDNRDPWISGLKIPSFQGAFTIFAPEAGPWVQLTAVGVDDNMPTFMSLRNLVSPFLLM
jgi:hypothetical protein